MKLDIVSFSLYLQIGISVHSSLLFCTTLKLTDVQSGWLWNMMLKVSSSQLSLLCPLINKAKKWSNQV